MPFDEGDFGGGGRWEPSCPLCLGDNVVRWAVPFLPTVEALMWYKRAGSEDLNWYRWTMLRDTRWMFRFKCPMLLPEDGKNYPGMTLSKCLKCDDTGYVCTAVASPEVYREPSAVHEDDQVNTNPDQCDCELGTHRSYIDAAADDCLDDSAEDGVSDAMFHAHGVVLNLYPTMPIELRPVVQQLRREAGKSE